MKRGIVRGLWGDIQRWKAKSDVKSAKQRDGDIDFICYTFGEENHNNLLKEGIKSVMLDSNCSKYPYHFRHKLDVYKAALQDYDEIVLMDWDCNLKQPGTFDPKIFWDSVGSKNVVQCSLYRWKRIAAPWREKRYDKSYLLNSSFIYIRDKSFPDAVINEYDKFPNLKAWRGNDEIATTYYIDKMMGGWQGEDYWFKHFEPELYYQGCNPVFKDKPNAMFNHFFHSWKVRS